MWISGGSIRIELLVWISGGSIRIELLVWISGGSIRIELLVWPVPTGSPSRGGDVAVYVLDLNQPSLPTPFYSVLECVSVFMDLSSVFHSIIFFSDSSPLSHSVLPVLFLPYRSF